MAVEQIAVSFYSKIRRVCSTSEYDGVSSGEPAVDSGLRLPLREAQVDQ